jgi:hypothetical protein
MAGQVMPGERLRERIADEYEHNGTEPDGREAEMIDRAAATADLIAELEALLDRDGPTSEGSAGQTVLHPAVAELRQQRSALQRFLAALDFSADGSKHAISAGARHAAHARWGKAGAR